MAISHAFSNTVADGTNTGIVRPVDWNSAHNQFLTVTGNTSGQSTFSGSNIVFGAGANITLSGVNATRFDIVGAAGGAGNTGSISAGTTRGTLGEVVFSNSNGISFGINGQTVTAAHNALTTARASTDAIGLNTAQSNVTWTVNSAGLSLDARGYAGTGTTFNGANLSGSMTVNSVGVQLSLSAGNYLTTARASNDAIGLNTAQSNVTWTVNSSGLSLDARGYAGTGTTFNGAGVSGSLTQNSNGIQVSLSVTQSNQNVTASNGGFAFQTLSFSNANGISFGTSAGSAITASHNALTTARASTDAIGLNTAQSNVTWTVNSAGLSLDARGYAGTGTTFAGANLSASMTLNSVGLNLSMSAAAPGGGGTTNQTGPNIGVSTAGNTAGSTGTVSTGNVVFVGSRGITLSQSTGAVGSDATISIMGPQSTLSEFVALPFAGKGAPMQGASSSVSLGQNSLYIYPVQFEDNMSFDHLKMPVFLTNSSSAAASVQKGITFRVGIYSRNATNATVLTQHYSTSYTMAVSHSSNNSWMLSIITAIGDSTSYNTLTASSAGINLSASLHGQRELIMPISSLFTPGEYWLAVAASTSSAGALGAIMNMNNYVGIYSTYNRPGLSTNSTNRMFFQQAGMGLYSTTTGALPSGISITQINGAGTQPILFLGTGTV